MRVIALSLSACALVAAACASRPVPVTEQPAEVSLGPAGLTIETRDAESAAQPVAVTPDEPVASPQPKPEPTPAEPTAIDPNEKLNLWDDNGHFRKEYWRGLSHEQRVHAVKVLAVCGNEGALRARDALEKGKLSEENLRSDGLSVANGSYGKFYPGRPDIMGGWSFDGD